MSEFTKFNCTKGKQGGKHGIFKVEFHDAYTPYVILGDTAKGKDLTRKSLLERDKNSNLK